MSITKISVITPTIRPDGLDIVCTGLLRQTHEEFEWLICGPENNREAVAIILDGKIPYTYIGNPPLAKGMVWDLNSSYNQLIDQARGDIILSLQDYTFFDGDALEKINWYMSNINKCVLSGWGHKYDKVYPVLGTELWHDPRIPSNNTTFDQIEFNFAALPKESLLAVGGFAEELDFEGFGMDAYCVLHRLSDMGGHQFVVDGTLKTYSLTHGRVPDWEEKNLIHGGYQNFVSKKMEEGKWPILK